MLSWGKDLSVAGRIVKQAEEEISGFLRGVHREYDKKGVREIPREQSCLWDTTYESVLNSARKYIIEHQILSDHAAPKTKVNLGKIAEGPESDSGNFAGPSSRGVIGGRSKSSSNSLSQGTHSSSSRRTASEGSGGRRASPQTLPTDSRYPGKQAIQVSRLPRLDYSGHANSTRRGSSRASSPASRAAQSFHGARSNRHHSVQPPQATVTRSTVLQAAANITPASRRRQKKKKK